MMLNLHFRKIGSDIPIDSLLVKLGTTLTSFELGLLATAGISEVSVFRYDDCAY